MNDQANSTNAVPTRDEFVQRACGHVESLQLWRDIEKGKAQRSILEAYPCARCMAAGWQKQQKPAEQPLVLQAPPAAQPAPGKASRRQ